MANISTTGKYIALIMFAEEVKMCLLGMYSRLVHFSNVTLTHKCLVCHARYLSPYDTVILDTRTRVFHSSQHSTVLWYFICPCYVPGISTSLQDWEVPSKSIIKSSVTSIPDLSRKISSRPAIDLLLIIAFRKQLEATDWPAVENNFYTPSTSSCPIPPDLQVQTTHFHPLLCKFAVQFRPDPISMFVPRSCVNSLVIRDVPFWTFG